MGHRASVLSLAHSLSSMKPTPKHSVRPHPHPPPTHASRTWYPAATAARRLRERDRRPPGLLYECGFLLPADALLYVEPSRPSPMPHRAHEIEIHNPMSSVEEDDHPEASRTCITSQEPCVLPLLQLHASLMTSSSRHAHITAVFL
jgi:hypothetical protein